MGGSAGKEYRSRSTAVNSTSTWRTAFTHDLTTDLLTVPGADRKSSIPILPAPLIAIVAAYCTPSAFDVLECNEWLIVRLPRRGDASAGGVFTSPHSLVHAIEPSAARPATCAEVHPNGFTLLLVSRMNPSEPATKLKRAFDRLIFGVSVPVPVPVQPPPPPAQVRMFQRTITGTPFTVSKQLNATHDVTHMHAVTHTHVWFIPCVPSAAAAAAAAAPPQTDNGDGDGVATMPVPITARALHLTFKSRHFVRSLGSTPRTVSQQK